jgi:hypothetical protein
MSRYASVAALKFSADAVKFTLRDVAGAWAGRALDNARRADRVISRMRDLRQLAKW